jgi:triacylglycerol lipase
VSLRTIARDAVWWAEDYLYALRWIVRGLFAGSPNSYLSGKKRPIVVVPGVWESWTFMVPLMKLLHQVGHPVYVIAGLGRNALSVVDTAAELAGLLREKDLTDVVVVAHSKGGLIGKYAMTYLDDDSRMVGMIAIAAPFSGSRYASYLLLPSLRAFSPRDPTTVRLKANPTTNPRIVSIFAMFDPHIPEGSELDGATNVSIPIGGHFQLLGDADVQRRVIAAADAFTRTAPG